MNNASDYYGRAITAAELADNCLTLTFADGVKIILTDKGQSCCEHRYITCDDELSKIVGGNLRKIEVRELKDESTHEQAFVEVATDECFVTVVTHNEHNGYYGGFRLSIDEVAS